MSQKVAKATYHVLLGTVAGRVINLIALLAVTSAIGPEGFGLLLIVGIITGLFDILLDIGFENYYIIKVDLKDKSELQSARVDEIEQAIFKLRLISNLSLFALQIGVSYALAGILFDAPVDTYLRILAFNYIANIAGKINEVRMKKRMEFGAITFSRFISNLISAILRVLMVFTGYGILGWAVGLVSGTFVYNLLLYKFGTFRPRKTRFSDDVKKEILWFAKHSWFMGVGQYLHAQSSNWILKTFNTIGEIGLIKFAASYTLDLHSAMFSSQSQLLFSYYSNHKEQPERILNAIHLMAAMGYISLGIPLILGIVFTAPIIGLIFNQQWQPAVAITSLYCMYTLIRISYSPGLGIHLATGKLKIGSLVTYLQLAITVVVLALIGLNDGSIFAFAVAVVIVNILGENLKVFSGLFFLKIYPAHFMKKNGRLLIIVAILVLMAFGIRHLFIVDTILSLFIVASVLYILQFLLLWQFDRNLSRQLLQRLSIILTNSGIPAIESIGNRIQYKIKP